MHTPAFITREIFDVLEKGELPVFIRRFLHDIYSESVTACGVCR